MDEQALIDQAKAGGTPALHVKRTPDLSASFLGGEPELPAGMAWPRGRNPLSFLAQINLGQVQEAMPIDWLPASGRLLFFYDMECQPWGFDPTERDCWQVILAPEGTDGAVSSAPEGAETFEQQHVIFSVVDTFSEDGPFLPDGHGMSEDAYEEFSNLVRTHDFGSAPLHQISGKPYAIQNENMETECQLASHGIDCGSGEGYRSPEAKALFAGAKDWRLLLQLDTDDDTGWMRGDSGILYFWVREDDARRGDFSRVWIVLQCC